MMVMGRFVNYVELRPNDIRFQSYPSGWFLLYSDIDQLAVSMDGKVQIRFTGKNRLGRQGSRSRTIDIENSEAFVEGLRQRAESATRKALYVVRCFKRSWQRSSPLRVSNASGPSQQLAVEGPGLEGSR